MVAGGNDVDTGVEQLFGHLERDAETGGGVLAVANDEIDLVFIPEAGQVFPNGLPSGSSNDVADHQDAHGVVGEAPYRAYSTARVSRMTMTLIWPGYSMESWIFLVMSRAIRMAARSSTFSGCTITRTSRPA